MPAGPHRHQKVERVSCVVITVSDTRTPETDKSGALLCHALQSAGHGIHAYAVVKDDPEAIARRIRAACDDPACQAVLLTGGTGLAARDTTYETLYPLLEKRLDGFGELFRMLSYEQIGPAAMLSRAVAGTIGRTAVFAMPGSKGGAGLAVEKLILPELGHIVWLLTHT